MQSGRDVAILQMVMAFLFLFSSSLFDIAEANYASYGRKEKAAEE